MSLCTSKCFPSFQFEDQKERELKNIYQGQNMMHVTLKDLNRKLDMIIGQQERTLSQIGSIGGGGSGIAVDTIKRHEVDEVLRSLRDSHSQINSVK
jgi:mannose-binding lectin 1